MRFAAAVFLWLCLVCNPLWAAPKIIHYGWDTPDTAALRANIQEIEKLPFDGMVIRIFPADPVKSGNASISRRPFSRKRYTAEEYQHAIDDLKAVKFTRFTDNFIQCVAQPGDLDWFDPEWSSAAHNGGILARLAKEAGFKGIMFDPELYGPSKYWSYQYLSQTYKNGRTFNQYQAQVRRRGKEFIQAINAEMPDIVILTLFGPSLPYQQSLNSPLKDCEYALSASFYDGMCEGATPGTVIVDGYEQSYNYRFREAFTEARKYMLTGPKSVSHDPKAYAQHVRAGFGIWADFNSGKLGWHPDDLTQNYFTPKQLRNSIAYALANTDGYVWVYNERLRWWDGTAPKEFVEALALAKAGPGPVEPATISIAGVPKASDAPDYADDKTFPRLGSNLKPIFDLPKAGWKFRTDSERAGEKNKWYAPTFDDSSWRKIKIAEFWEEQIGPYDGSAWYRLRFRAPSIKTKNPIMLAFGAADETATVWLNGKLIGVHDMWDFGWNTPFMFDVTSRLKQGKDNLIAVRVFDNFGGGGLWKSIKLMEKTAAK